MRCDGQHGGEDRHEAQDASDEPTCECAAGGTRARKGQREDPDGGTTEGEQQPMAKVESPLVGETALVDETEGRKDELFGLLLHQEMQNDRNGKKSRAGEQRYVNEGHVGGSCLSSSKFEIRNPKHETNSKHEIQNNNDFQRFRHSNIRFWCSFRMLAL
jgi:hypothetical protein